MIISFAWTTKAFVEGRKTVTRRFWDPRYAGMFYPGLIVSAYDKSPKRGGKPIGRIRIIKVYRQRLGEMTDEDELKEGGQWGSAKAFIAMMGGPDKIPWVIEFQKL